MKNSTVLRVITLGAIAIIGIIALQSYWVVSTWDINEREFNKKVRLALYNVAKSLVELNQTRLPPRNIIMQQTS
ncbi:MAG: sensor histidine kinase, partial [Saprospiraceae bacterium]|nr:sensor histidine kinase [Saprospiraceae bacterium]